jgi:hypothetical protein
MDKRGTTMKMIKNITKKLAEEKGLAMPMALVLIVVAAAIVVPVLAYMSTNLNIDTFADKVNKRVYASDAGIQWALWNFKYNTGYSKPAEGATVSLPFSDSAFTTETIAVTVMNEGSLGYRIRSQAANDSGTSVVVAYVSNNSSSSNSTGSPFKYAVATLNGDLNISGSSGTQSDIGTEGDVYASGNIIMGWSCRINGDATLTGSLTDPNPSNIAGIVTYTGTPMARPTWMDTRTDAYKASTAITMPSCSGSTSWSDAVGTYSNPLNISGNMALSKTGTYVFNGPVCVNGNLTISSGVNAVYFNSTVKVTGYINMGGNGYTDFNDTVYVGKYLYCAGSRSARFFGKVRVDGQATTSGYSVYFDGSKYSGVTWDVVFADTLKATGNMRFGSGRTYSFNDVIYATGNIMMDGNSGNYSSNSATFVADGNITISGSSQVSASSVTTMPFIISTAGNIVVNGSGATNAIFYAPVGNVTVSNSGAVTGSIVAASVNLSGNAHATFPVALASRGDIQGGGGSGSSSDDYALRSYSIQ